MNNKKQKVSADLGLFKKTLMRTKSTRTGLVLGLVALAIGAAVLVFAPLSGLGEVLTFAASLATSVATPALGALRDRQHLKTRTYKSKTTQQIIEGQGIYVREFKRQIQKVKKLSKRFNLSSEDQKYKATIVLEMIAPKLRVKEDHEIPGNTVVRTRSLDL